MRTTAGITAVLVGAVLVATAACGADADRDRAGTEPANGSARTAPGGAALGKGALDKAALVGTVAGYRVTRTAARDIPPEGGYAVNRKECAPIGALIGGHLPVQPAAEVFRTVEPVDPKDATVGNIWLSSYGDGRAARALAAVDTAVDRCRGSFTTVGLTYHSVRRVKSPGSGEAAFRVTADVGGQRLTMNYRVVRSGDVVAGFYGVNMLHPEDGAIPDAVVAAQVARLGG
ncbi:hypothetical protein [Streptomyces fuscichromogenes]|uniref:Lipoprotein n=1 Tax=Streptomyces fuscichromogenes TaxID=1324013 RepID=A0A917XMK2_9ACTN|nr:hypothetical protein [Streptomyces fuscichromogenes]GGN39816.1 hypothetical protein GCM10011578_086800 [Streptomyces fuscichromogenes]